MLQNQFECSPMLSCRRHPACMVLLHNPSSSATRPSSVLALDQPPTATTAATTTTATTTQGPLDSDPYLPGEPEPSKTRAIESSLWELEALRSHYSPHVSNIMSHYSPPRSHYSFNQHSNTTCTLASAYHPVPVGQTVLSKSVSDHVQGLCLRASATSVGWLVGWLYRAGFHPEQCAGSQPG